MNLFDVNDLDPGIKDLVLYLRKSGLNTVASCQGGRGHTLPGPTVYLKPQPDQSMSGLWGALNCVLIEGGYEEFHLMEVNESPRSKEKVLILQFPQEGKKR